MNYGYIRVSSKDQCEDRQWLALKQFDIPRKNIYVDKVSGKNFDRPQYNRLVKRLKKGDVLIVLSIDRLGRNYKEIVREWQELTTECQADIKVLDMPLLDTTQYKDLLGTFISDLILQVLSFVAEQERKNIRTRQSEGIAIAKANKIKFGRPKTKIPDNFEKIYLQWKNGEITATQAIKETGLKRTNFYKIANSFNIKV